MIADFLSPRVSSLLSKDETIREFHLNTQDPDHRFGRFLSLGYGCEVAFEDGDLHFVRSICRELLNSELFQLTFEGTDGEIENHELFVRFAFSSEMGEVTGDDLKLMASRFWEFSVSDLEHLSVEVLGGILSEGELLLNDEDSLFEVIYRVASRDLSYFPLLEFVRFEFLSDRCIQIAFEFLSRSFEFVTRGIWDSLGRRLTLSANPPRLPRRFVLPTIESQIIADCPSIFSVFQRKTFRLLYRGTRDSFQSGDFHRCCDGHAHTMTLVMSTDDWVFGGYTPVPWNSRNSHASDPDLESFLFTITNPHGLAPQIFPLQAPETAIHDRANLGPSFGSNAQTGCNDLRVFNQCNRNHGSSSQLGGSYVNDTGLAGNTVFTGEYNFTVKELEVFEVVD
jgi:hypothetical protein